MERLKKWNNRLEKIWLVIAIISTIIALYFAIIDQFNGDFIYFFLAVLAWGIYLVRRGLGKRLNKNL